jgi:hypothetical protein
MKLEASILLKEVEEKFQSLVPLLEALKDYIAGNASLTSELADIAFVCREIDINCDEFMKRVREISRLAQSCCCITLATTGEDIVRTDFCSASPNPKPWFKIPYKREQNPQRWDLIMAAIGVSDLANRRDLVRIHAPGLMDYCGELIGHGDDPPAGIDPKECTSMELNLRITKKR